MPKFQCGQPFLLKNMQREKINECIKRLRATNDPDEQDEIKIEIDELEKEYRS